MWRKNVAQVLILTLASALLTPNCASIIRHRTQGIPVTSSPAGATVIVNGVQQGMTPLLINLPRKLKGQVIRIESPGYNPVEIRLRRTLSGGIFLGNLMFGLIAGVIPATFIWFRSSVETGKDQGTLAWVAWGALAVAVGGGLTGIDMSNGNGYSLSPADLTVTLKKADGTPRVDMMLVDAEDFRNIKWIRVRRD